MRRSKLSPPFVAGLVWLVAGGFLAGRAAGRGEATLLPMLAMILLPIASVVVWRDAWHHSLPRRRLDALLVGLCLLAWIAVLAGS